jgi:hypothetical protein
MGIENQNQDDEVEVNLEQPGKFEIEVVDDTPAEDRNRKPLAKDVLADDADADAEEYSEKVKKRINEVKRAVHDERRAREAAERRATELERVAQEAIRRSQLVQRQYTYGEAAYADDTVKAAQAAVAAAKAAYRQAYDAGDPDKVTDAAEKLSEAKNKESQALAWAAQAKQKVQLGALQTKERGVDSEQHLPATQQSTPAADPRAEQWMSENPWWNTDPEMTAAAWGVHERLTRAGVDPRRDAEKYYQEVDATMRRRFPEYEWDDTDSAAPPRNKDGTFAPRSKSATAPVAPVKRVSTGNPNPNKVVLTKTQVETAERLGVSLEEYAREWVKLNKGAQS